MNLIRVELLGDFPFVASADLANAIAALITPFVRPLIQGPTPLFLITAPTAGSGKSKLAELLMLPASGTRPTLIPVPKSQDEWSRRILAAVRPSPTAVLLDNLGGTLDSPILASALTSSHWADRVVGTSDSLEVPIQCVWLATGNNPSLSPELSRRSVLIRLDRNMEKPWEYTGFRHKDLVGWAEGNRNRLIWAALVLIQSAAQAGWPKSSETFGSYESWTALVGGVLENAGVNGFLSSQHEAYEAIASGETEWKEFLMAWHSEYGSDPISARSLSELANRFHLLPSVLAGREPAKAAVAIGKAISNKCGQRYGDLTVHRPRRERSMAWLYQVTEIGSTSSLRNQKSIGPTSLENQNE